MPFWWHFFGEKGTLNQHLLITKRLRGFGKALRCVRSRLDQSNQLLQILVVVGGLEHAALQRDALLAVVNPVVLQHVQRHLPDNVEVFSAVSLPFRVGILPEGHIQSPVHAFHAPVRAYAARHALHVPA